MSTSLSNAASGGSSAADSLRGSSVSTNVPSSTLMSNLSTNAALFREIHKNTWLKRLTADGKKITVGPKKSEKSWVVFCVHDDTQALLEGYAEPRQAASHNPEWIVSMQGTQHISHALIPNSHEFEFVVTLHNEVVRFHAMSWEVMQEWVETLRSKLREMKILSPRENLYTKLPEIRAPLLPTRDPTSPLPAPPPVPAALVPGIERVLPQSLHHSADVTNTDLFEDTNVERTISSGPSCTIITTNTTTTVTQSTPNLSLTSASQFSQTPVISSMSNTLTQNLINMLSDPIIAYSEQLLGEDLDAQPSSTDETVNITPKANLKQTSITDSEKQSNDSKLGSRSEKEVNFDIGITGNMPFGQNENFDDFILHERLIPRPHTSRSLSAGAADQEFRQLAYKSTLNQNNSKTQKSTNINNITELEIGAVDDIANKSHVELPSITTTPTPTDSLSNVTIIKLTNSNHEINSQANCDMMICPSSKMKLEAGVGEIFRYPDNSIIKQEDHYKSNVQIIPSSLNSSTIQVVSGLGTFTTSANQQYLIPAIKNNAIQTVHKTDDAATIATTTQTNISSPRSHLESHQITTVHVGSDKSRTYGSLYGTCFSNAETLTQQFPKSPILPKKIIVPANSSGITNISVNHEEEKSSCDSMPQNSRAANENDTNQCAISSIRYEKIFLSSSTPLVTKDKSQVLPSGKENMSQIAKRVPVSPKFPSSPQQRAEATTIKFEEPNHLFKIPSSSLPSSPIPRVAFSGVATKKQKPPHQPASQNSTNTSDDSQQQKGSKSLNQCKEVDAAMLRSPVMQRKSNVTATCSPSSSVPAPAVPIRTRYLTRGLTEAVITTRPSRKDLCLLKTSTKPKMEINSNSAISASTNNNIEAITASNSNTANLSQTEVNSMRSEQPLEQRRRSSSTSEAHSQRGRAVNNNEFISNRLGMNAVVRMQPPPHSTAHTSAAAAGVSVAKRMTLREQQVMQLRREIMHPGGVRLQLRRKDCLGSIAWVDSFGAVWIAGWKQKEHPVLYNALHIGDQLVSIAGVAVSVAADANKIIRNTNTLFVEVVIRRIPLGRGYAIRREREGQCLGLIRDGNTATIVDVVPNSLAARHGLPPKAQSCDGSTLTFWVLTEINARPLNLFFKEHEIRDRLNSVGRDISILVQPSDLITKLKKQLKSLRSYKDYLVQ